MIMLSSRVHTCSYECVMLDISFMVYPISVLSTVQFFYIVRVYIHMI